MDGTAILFILAIAGVVSMAFSATKKLLDEVPEVLNSASRARDAWDRFKNRGDTPSNPNELPPRADDERPPTAA